MYFSATLKMRTIQTHTHTDTHTHECCQLCGTSRGQLFQIFFRCFFFHPDLKCSNFWLSHFFCPISSLKTCFESELMISKILKSFQKIQNRKSYIEKELKKDGKNGPEEGRNWTKLVLQEKRVPKHLRIFFSPKMPSKA